MGAAGAVRSAALISAMCWSFDAFISFFGEIPWSSLFGVAGRHLFAYSEWSDAHEGAHHEEIDSAGGIDDDGGRSRARCGRECVPYCI
jgi:hypothetical protein